MKLRIANKVLSDGMNVTRYRASTMDRAFRRIAKTPDGQQVLTIMAVLRKHWDVFKRCMTETDEQLAS